MIFALHLKMAGKEKQAKKIVEKYLTDEIGIKAVYATETFTLHVSENRTIKRCTSIIPGYIFIEMDNTFINPNGEKVRIASMPAKTQHFLKHILAPFNVNILKYDIPEHQFREFFQVENLNEEPSTVVISINEEMDDIEQSPFNKSVGVLKNLFRTVITKVKNGTAQQPFTICPRKHGGTRLSFGYELWKQAYALFDPLGKEVKESFNRDQTYLPFIMRIVQGSV